MQKIEKFTRKQLIKRISDASTQDVDFSSDEENDYKFRATE